MASGQLPPSKCGENTQKEAQKRYSSVQKLQSETQIMGGNLSYITSSIISHALLNRYVSCSTKPVLCGLSGVNIWSDIITGLPNPVGISVSFHGFLLGCLWQSSRKMGRLLLFFFIFRVGKSLACHSPAKWCLCA